MVANGFDPGLRRGLSRGLPRGHLNGHERELSRRGCSISRPLRVCLLELNFSDLLPVLLLITGQPAGAAGPEEHEEIFAETHFEWVEKTFLDDSQQMKRILS